MDLKIQILGPPDEVNKFQINVSESPLFTQ